ncbi:MAG: antibiotic biosynthesis monooxygenase [Clostridia bacterium]|nr:antibiotic biosynthesis monooxygenase [Clostridia bacterium]
MRVIAKRLIKDEKLEEVKKIYEELVDLTRMEEGCNSYVVCQDPSNPRLLVVLEDWRDEEVFSSHLHSSHYLRLGPELNKRTEKKYDLEKYEQLL